MKYVPLGSSDDIGASCHYLLIDGTGILLDAGVDPEEDGSAGIPRLDLLLDHSYEINLSEVIAFGDNYNDEEMIGGVGMGVAVGNARDEVKAVSNAITKGNKD